jgi:hypothetical protein
MKEKSGGIPSQRGEDRFAPLFPPQIEGFGGGNGGWRPAALSGLCGEKKGRREKKEASTRLYGRRCGARRLGRRCGARRLGATGMRPSSFRPRQRPAGIPRFTVSTWQPYRADACGAAQKGHGAKKRSRGVIFKFFLKRLKIKKMAS